MRIYLNSGRDVETPEQMKNAVESSGGMPGVRAMLCDTQNIPKPVPVKWEGVSFINNVEYGNEGGHMRLAQVNFCRGVSLIYQKNTLYQC